ncbi:hypothetical protein N5C39_22570 [Enterobacter bugandensis]|uniref:Uncharacterized protein n=1 Tax=Enterobacter bugandensis TaxID=881260 RepID=A0AA42PUX3_9ENTR|nr:hypothetical protein [Enterobacter bugandensis]MDH1321159.1 hypothetical protein [Enterobacter bugandensis]
MMGEIIDMENKDRAIMKKNSPEKIVLATVEAETLIQRIARNVAWYALRVARPEYLKAFKSAHLTYVNIRDPEKVREFVRYVELQQSSEADPAKKVPAPLHHVIFRG